MMFQGLSQAAEVGDVKMEVADEVPTSDLSSRESSFCLFIKFAKEVMDFYNNVRPAAIAL